MVSSIFCLHSCQLETLHRDTSIPAFGPHSNWVVYFVLMNFESFSSCKSLINTCFAKIFPGRVACHFHFFTGSFLEEKRWFR